MSSCYLCIKDDLSWHTSTLLGCCDRSGGDRGADVATLRGTHGPDFEGEAIINRGGDAVCGCFGGTEMKQRLLLIKGPFVFVFSSESDPSPKYAISLAHLTAKFQGPSNGMYLVTLESSLGDVEYELMFKENSAAVLFVTAAKRQAAVGETEEIRKVRQIVRSHLFPHHKIKKSHYHLIYFTP